MCSQDSKWVRKLFDTKSSVIIHSATDLGRSRLLHTTEVYCILQARLSFSIAESLKLPNLLSRLESREYINYFYIKIVNCTPLSMKPWAAGKKSFNLMWRCHQLLSGFLAKGHLPQVLLQSANDKED